MRRRGKRITIHRCGNCGHYEGESPQAGCCPRCGRASNPIPVQVVVVR